jgi:hypothetical protein
MKNEEDWKIEAEVNGTPGWVSVQRPDKEQIGSSCGL